MAAWALHETKMTVEQRRSIAGRDGWTVTWKGRGWDRSFEDYLALGRAGPGLTRGGSPLAGPPGQDPLPGPGAAVRGPAYRLPTPPGGRAWGGGGVVHERACAAP